MKKWRILAILLALSVLICSLSSCSSLYYLYDYFELGEIETSPTSSSPSGRLPILPSDDGDTELAYTLTQADVDEGYRLISECRALFLSDERDELVLQTALDEMEDAYYHVATQSQIAYIYYCVDQVSAEASENYLFASAAVSDLYSAYNAICLEIDASNSPNRAFFFKDWTEEEFAEMRGYSPEIAEYSKANDEIIVSYYQLSDEQFYDGAARMYLQIIANNNAIARLNGYSNYWRYASEQIYNRRYNSTDMTRMRSYAKNYLVSYYLTVSAQYEALSAKQKADVAALFRGEYDLLEEDYISGYISTFDEETQAMLGDMLEGKNAIMPDSENAYDGAFTMFLYEYERPISYFGPNYQGSFTIVHEMGHYHSALVKGDLDIALDLAEVHSQSSEWLFLSYLEGVIDPELARNARLYLLQDSLQVILYSLIIDEFEQKCYEMQPTEAWRLDYIMATILNSYGGGDWCAPLSQYYWRCVVLDNPVYYLSYGVSALAAMQVYAEAESVSFASGQALYLALIDLAAQETDFISALRGAGLSLPTEQETYEKINLLVQKSR